MHVGAKRMFFTHYSCASVFITKQLLSKSPMIFMSPHLMIHVCRVCVHAFVSCVFVHMCTHVCLCLWCVYLVHAHEYMGTHSHAHARKRCWMVSLWFSVLIQGLF